MVPVRSKNGVPIIFTKRRRNDNKRQHCDDDLFHIFPQQLIQARDCTAYAQTMRVAGISAAVTGAQFPVHCLPVFSVTYALGCYGLDARMGS